MRERNANRVGFAGALVLLLAWAAFFSKPQLSPGLWNALAIALVLSICLTAYAAFRSTRWWWFASVLGVLSGLGLLSTVLG
jgi:hypothetical protein